MNKKFYGFVLLFILFQNVQAIEVSWNLSPSYTVRDGLWIFTKNNTSAPVTAYVSVTRKLIGSHANGDPYFEPINIILNIVTYTLDGERIVHYSRQVTSAEFPKNTPSIIITTNFDIQPLDLSEEHSGPTGGVYYSGQGVYLEYSVDNGQNFDYRDQKVYLPVTPNGYYATVPIHEGEFIHVVQTGKVYFRIGDNLHYINSPSDFSRLFTYDNLENTVKDVGENRLQEFSVGPTIDSNTSIIHYNSTLYFKQETIIRRFPSPEIFNKYHFKWVYTNVTNLNGLTIGNPVY